MSYTKAESGLHRFHGLFYNRGLYRPLRAEHCSKCRFSQLVKLWSNAEEGNIPHLTSLSLVGQENLCSISRSVWVKKNNKLHRRDLMKSLHSEQASNFLLFLHLDRKLSNLPVETPPAWETRKFLTGGTEDSSPGTSPSQECAPRGR